MKVEVRLRKRFHRGFGSDDDVEAGQLRVGVKQRPGPEALMYTYTEIGVGS